MSTGFDTGAEAAPKNDYSVLMFAGLYPPAYRGGGPIRTTFAIARTYSATTTFRVITSDHDWGENDPLNVAVDTWVQRDEARVWYVRDNSLRSLFRAVRSANRDALDFVYLNSFFSPIYSIIPAALFKIGLFGEAKLIVAPRGEFGSAARAYKSAKKNLFVKFCRLSRLHRNTTWHASSDIEAADVLRTFPGSKVIVRLNESTLPASALRYETAEAGRTRLVYIGRIAEIKGVSILLAALRGIDSPVRLDIYGPCDDQAYLQACKELAEALPKNIEISFNDGVENSEVRELFANSDAFFLPTEQENFGHAIAESLSAGCPVYVADVTPWSEVIRSGGGAVVQSREVGAWHEALVEFCALSNEELHARKLATADAYERWRAAQYGPSIFELAAREPWLQYRTSE